MKIIRGKKAVVTGAASGIGRAVALALADEGANLFLIDRDLERLAGVAGEVAERGVEVMMAVCDLAIPSDVATATTRVRVTWNDELHILANCAGIACYGPFHLQTEETWRQVLAVNLLAPMQIIHELLPALAAADEAHILNVCSVAGLVPSRRLAVYQASKFGLVGFTLALRSDYQRDHFGVTALCPGFVRTPLLSNLKDAEGHRRLPTPPDFLCTTPEAVAAIAIDAMRRDRGLVVVTLFAKLAWWLVRFFPHLLDWINREAWRRRGKVVFPDPMAES